MVMDHFFSLSLLVVCVALDDMALNMICIWLNQYSKEMHSGLGFSSIMWAALVLVCLRAHVLTNEDGVFVCNMPLKWGHQQKMCSSAEVFTIIWKTEISSLSLMTDLMIAFIHFPWFPNYEEGWKIRDISAGSCINGGGGVYFLWLYIGSRRNTSNWSLYGGSKCGVKVWNCFLPNGLFLLLCVAEC